MARRLPAILVILVICLPLQLMGLLRGPAVMAMWIPMAAFEIPLGVWWLVKGTAEGVPV